MTFDNEETIGENANVLSYATPVNHTWHEWDADSSENDVVKSVVPVTTIAAEEMSAATAAKPSFIWLTGLVNGTVSYLRYTRRWYISLSSVGAAM